MSGRLLGIVAVLLLATAALAADNAGALVGTWTGKATGPEGGPPTGDITVVFEKEGTGLKGTITVKGAGGLQYSGQVTNISLKKRLFSGTAIFRLGENPLQAEVSGPLKGKTIAGTFSVVVQGQKMGEGTFSITRESSSKP
jgi:hypothetical protein